MNEPGLPKTDGWTDRELFAVLSNDDRIEASARAYLQATGIARLLGPLGRRFGSCRLILTNRRLMIARTAAQDRLVGAVQEIDLAGVRSVDVSNSGGRLSLTLCDGRRLCFASTLKNELREFATGLDAVMRTVATRATEARSESSVSRALCIGCGATVLSSRAQCRCGLRFKRTGVAVRCALLFPGGGHFYLGLVRTGTAAVIAESGVLLFVLFMLQLSRVTREDPGSMPLRGCVAALVALTILAAPFVLLQIRMFSAMHAWQLSRERIPETRIGTVITPWARVDDALKRLLRPAARVMATGRSAVERIPRATLDELSATIEGAAVLLRDEGFRSAEESIVDIAFAAASETPRVARRQDPAEVETHGMFRFHPTAAQRFLQEGAMRREKQIAVLERVWSVLEPVLEPDESIVLATRGASPYSITEYLGAYFHLYFVRRCVYVFTDRRIIHIPTFVDFAPRGNVLVIRYHDVDRFRFHASFGLGVNFKLSIQFRAKKRESLNRLAVEDHEWLSERLGSLLVEAPGTPTVDGLRYPLCTSCGADLRPDVYECASCGQRYRPKWLAQLVALVVPGGGYFSTGHMVLGSMDAVVETFLALNAVALLVAVLAGARLEYLHVGVFFLYFLFFEKLLSIHHAGEMVSELIPLKPIAVDPPAIRGQQSRMLSVVGYVVTGGLLLLILSGVIERIPTIAAQARLSKELVKLDAERQALESRVAAFEPRVQAANARAKRLYSAETRLDRFIARSSWSKHRSWFEKSYPYVRYEFEDPVLNEEYNAALNEYFAARLEEEPEADRRERESLALALDEHARRVEAAGRLREEPASVWLRVTPTEVFNDLAVHASEDEVVGGVRSRR